MMYVDEVKGAHVTHVYALYAKYDDVGWYPVEVSTDFPKEKCTEFKKKFGVKNVCVKKHLINK